MKYVRNYSKRMAIGTSISKEVIDIVDEIARSKGWTRPQTLRHMIEGLAFSLKNSGNITSPWFSLHDLEITPTLEKVRVKRSED